MAMKQVRNAEDPSLCVDKIAFISFLGYMYQVDHSLVGWTIA
jgi:hypothetical protein